MRGVTYSKLDEWYDYNMTLVASQYEWQPYTDFRWPNMDLYKFVQRE